MHESSMMKGVLRRIETIAAAEHATRVVRVSVRLGALSQMSPGHFAEHFTHAVQGTVAADAELDVSVSDNALDAAAQDIIVESVEVEA